MFVSTYTNVCGNTGSDVIHIPAMTSHVSTKTNVCIPRLMIILTIGGWWWRKHGGIKVCEVCEWISCCGVRWLWFAYWYRRWGAECVLMAGGILKIWPLTHYLVQAFCFNITWSFWTGLSRLEMKACVTYLTHGSSNIEWKHILVQATPHIYVC